MALIIQVVNTSPKLTVSVVGYSNAASSFAVGMRCLSLLEAVWVQKSGTNY